MVFTAAMSGARKELVSVLGMHKPLNRGYSLPCIFKTSQTKDLQLKG